MPLAAHAAAAMRGAAVDLRIAVVASGAVADLFGGFEIVLLDKPGPQSDSLRAGVALAEARGAGRIVVTLGDMPLVTATLIDRVLAIPDAAAVTDGTRRMPPAAFPAEQFPRIQALEGDRGAGALLRELPAEALIRVAPETLTDIDTPEALAAIPPPSG